ncbi:MAG: hypothetical protein J3K34DRAFT_187179 [Monoraphidium minutum]|nr:MAG: hypothetical protein J3K34DRAFT_187179 [Monoraphidium minutum]
MSRLARLAGGMSKNAWRPLPQCVSFGRRLPIARGGWRRRSICHAAQGACAAAAQCDPVRPAKPPGCVVCGTVLQCSHHSHSRGAGRRPLPPTLTHTQCTRGARCQRPAAQAVPRRCACGRAVTVPPIGRGTRHVCLRPPLQPGGWEPCNPNPRLCRAPPT